MSNEKIKEFYAKLETNAEFKKDIENLKLHRSEDLSEECIRKIVSEIILPWDKKLGYNFSEAELLEFEKSQASSMKEKLNTEDLENVSGGINLMALLMAALSFISPVNTLGTTDAALANRQEALTMNPTLPTDITTETLPIEYPKDESSRLDEPEQYLQDDGSRSEENIEKVEFSVEEEAISHDDFLKIIDDSKEVNATAVFLHNTMEANGTWALSSAEIEEAAQNAQATATTQNALPKEVQDSLNMLKIFPTDKEGLKPYLAIEVDKFKDDLDEFLASYNATDITDEADKFCESTPNDYSDERKEPRNISRETILAIKETFVREYNARFVKTTKKRKHGGLGRHVKKRSFPFPSLEGDLQQLKGNIEGKEHYLDKLLEIIKNKLSDYDRAKVVHDWVAKNIAYNYADASYGPENCEGTFRNHAEQVFKNKMGVCRGYAHLTELMMRTLGIPCVYTVSRNHAFNAIFINGEWFLIDTTWDAYKKTNKHLSGFSRKNVTQNYKGDPRYNQITPGWKKHITHDYFPSNQDTAEGYNKKFIADDESHEVKGAMFRLNRESGVCEISMQPSTDGDMVVWDATRECIVDGELKLPDEIQKQAKKLIINDQKVLNKIKKLHIPDNIRLGNALEASLKNVDEVTVDPDNPHYIIYTPRLGKPGLYYRTEYPSLSAKPLWTKPD